MTHLNGQFNSHYTFISYHLESTRNHVINIVGASIV